ncbi:MAG: hypothetical protein ACFFA6_11440, partial [Promethearchaeota archaeon]
PEHDPPGEDWSECTIEKTFIIYDDDVDPPQIQITPGDLSVSDGEAVGGVLVSWEISDYSGISQVNVTLDGLLIATYGQTDDIITDSYLIPNDLGEHIITIWARDNDNDPRKENDWAEIVEQANIMIYDDDITPPEIVINYIGDGRDNDPGYFEWSVFDVDSGISEIEIQITYSSTDGSEDFELFLPSNPTGTWDIPSNLGHYTLAIFARDNDDDRTLLADSLTIEVITEQEIIDDDVEPPELSNLLIIPDLFEINITFDAIDESGIGDISIFINGELVEPLTQNQYGNTYSFILNNQWIFERGVCEVSIQVEDGDCDRPNDALTSSITGTFQNALIQMYEYIDWQLEELKAYIDENLPYRKSQCLIWKLSKAQKYLAEAFNLVEDGKITCALYHDKIAKVFVQLAELKAEIHHKRCRVSDDHTEYIVNMLHTIRNNIVILMGASTGSQQAYDIAYIEVDLLNLSDFIEEEIPCCKGKYLSRKVECASGLLEIAIFKIAMDKDIECLLRCAQWKLKCVICKIEWYLHKGRISEDLAYYLIDEITRIIEAIEKVIIGSIVDTTPPNIMISYDGAGHDKDPGVWHVFIEDLESGLGEVQILVDGNVYIHEQELNGVISKSYDIPVPGSRGYHTITVIAKNDINFDGDQEISTDELITRIEIYVPPPPPPPPPM